MQSDRALKFYEEVLGCGYLHYGLWSAEDPLTLDGLKAAQERYADLLAAWIPAGVKTVLDAGCGTGGNAKKLAGLGYEVEGLSPDPFQQQRFTERTGLPFHLARFQDFVPSRHYDLVLMSESCQYVPVEGLFAAARRAAPGGHLLVSDYFPLVKDGSRMTRSGHLRSDFLAAATASGFVLERQEDITDRVTPTLDLARQISEQFAIPTLKLVAATAEKERPWLYRGLRWLLRRRIAKVDAQRILLDSTEFKRLKRYEVFLFRIPADPR